MVFFFIHTFKKVRNKQTNSRKNRKNRERAELEIFPFFHEFSFFPHIFKGLHIEMYLSFILATFCNDK